MSMEYVGIIGLGYVGLPLAVEFGKTILSKGYDLNLDRINQLKKLVDITGETSTREISDAHLLSFTHDLGELRDCKFKIIAVPTPIDGFNTPDLSLIQNASSAVAAIIQKGDIIIYESTVYPGATEEICVPILEENSGLIFNQDFFVGYSPERINPGDKNFKLKDIVKLTSGSTLKTADAVDELYSRIIFAGTHKCSSIKVAEAAKVIENTQRDVNIALMNEISMIFDRLSLDTTEVLEASSTKWNFLPFTPGLVGGHCIGVDPYYLAHKARAVNYHPELILAGRRINDTMASHVAKKLVEKLILEGNEINRARVLVLGLTFKPNCRDIRNTKVIDLINEFKTFGILVDVYDPLADVSEVKEKLSITLMENLEEKDYAAIVLAVPHTEFIEIGAQAIRKLGRENHILFDLYSAFGTSEKSLRL